MIDSKAVALDVRQLKAEKCFAYPIVDAGTREAALVDPKADRVAAYLRELEERGLRLRLVIETHTHADHLSGAAELRARTGAEVLISVRATSEVATRRLRDGDRVTLGNHDIEVIASPGHTDDSVSLLVGGALLTGDALLIGGAGRTDFQNGSPEALYETLHERFAALLGELTIYPGHDYAGHSHSTLGRERRTNPLLLLNDRHGFVSALSAARQPKPGNMDAIVTANIRGVTPSPRITIEELGQALGGARAPLVVDVRLPAEYRSSRTERVAAAGRDRAAARRAAARSRTRARLSHWRPRSSGGGGAGRPSPASPGRRNLRLARGRAPRHRRQGPREPRASGPHRGRRPGVRRRHSGPRVQPVVRPAARIRGRRPRLCRDHRSVWNGDAAGQASCPTTARAPTAGHARLPSRPRRVLPPIAEGGGS